MEILKQIDGKKTYAFTLLAAIFVVIHFIAVGDYSTTAILNLLADGSIAATIASLRHGIAKGPSVPAAVVLFFLLGGVASADPINVSDIFNHIPSLKQGVAYDINGKGVDYFTTAELANYKDFSLSAGYSTSDKIVASLDYDIGGLEKLGINIPLLSVIDLRIGMYVGIGNLSAASSNGNGRNKFAYGPEATIVSLHF